MTHPANRPENALRRVRRARKFGENTCPASRHVEMIGEFLLRGVLAEDPVHCGGSILSVIESLYKARSLLIKHGIDPRSGLPIGSQERDAWHQKQIDAASKAFGENA